MKKSALPFTPIIASGLLYGLSFSPFFLPFSLGFLAWFCWIPLFLQLKQFTNQPKHYFSSIFLTFLLGNLIAIWWLTATISVSTYILTIIFLITLTFTLIFIPFYYLQRQLGWQKASYLLPFLWISWEWLITLQDWHAAGAFFGYSQIEYGHLIQYSDITGVWGVSFWLVLLNVVLTDGIIHFKKSAKRHVVFSIATVITLFIIPLIYGHFSIQHWQQKLTQLPEIKLALLQPNHHNKTGLTVQEKIETMVIDSSKIISTQHPDLIVWPEAAVTHNASEISHLRDYLLTVIGRWNTPLLFGFLEHLETEQWQWKKPLLFGLLKPIEGSQVHNSALLLTPQLAHYAKDRQSEALPLKIYRKQHLMPLTEKVPYSDVLPALQTLSIEVNGHQSNVREGQDEGFTFAFADKKGNIRRTGIRICYEVMYPSSTTKMIRNGAEMLAILSNDATFGRTPGSYRISGYARILAITTRRSIARDSKTGLTFFVNPLGEMYGKIPWWQKGVSVDSVKLNTELSFYSRYPDLLPKISLLFLLLFIIYQRFFNKE